MRRHHQQVLYSGWLLSRHVARNIHTCLAKGRYTLRYRKVIVFYWNLAILLHNIASVFFSGHLVLCNGYKLKVVLIDKITFFLKISCWWVKCCLLLFYARTHKFVIHCLYACLPLYSEVMKQSCCCCRLFIHGACCHVRTRLVLKCHIPLQSVLCSSVLLIVEHFACLFTVAADILIIHFTLK